MLPLTDYVLKTVPLKFKGADMSFDLSHALFSSFDIDQGSKLLLKLVAKNVDGAAVGSIVDIGSGVGVLGIACARAYAGASLRMRDRDALACAFSERNAKRNKVKPTSVDHALFLNGIESERYDLALCNVPAKAGTPVLDRFLRDLPGIVSERGYGAIVVVNPIAAASLESLAASGAQIVAMEEGPAHTAAVFKRAPGDDAGTAASIAKAVASAAVAEFGEDPNAAEASWAVFQRSEETVRVGRSSYKVKGYWGLPEFDTASFATELAMDLCENAMAGCHVRRALVVNPGVGRAACYIKARARAASIDLCGRDALSVAASERNVAMNDKPDARQAASADASPLDSASGFAARSSVHAGIVAAFPDELPDASYDLIVEFPDITPRVDCLGESWAQAVRLLKSGASFVASMPSTAMDRFERKRPKGFTRLAERKKKGFACAAWRRD